MNFQKLIDYFRETPKNTASLAKERLQIVISHERATRQQTRHDFLPLLQKELMAVISKYFPVEENQVRVELAKTGDLSILELNITLPEQEKTENTAAAPAAGSTPPVARGTGAAAVKRRKATTS